MRNLIDFLIKYSVVFLFLFLETIAMLLIIKNQGYQKSVALSSANAITGNIYEKTNKISSFFKLSAANEQLSNQNATLQNKIAELESLLYHFQDSTKTHGWQTHHIDADREYDYISAKIVRITTNRQQNFITINKGQNDSVKTNMGVISAEGVVGIVARTSAHFAIIIPILNPNLQLNCKFKHNNYVGPLIWKGNDYRYAYLQDIARHVKFSIGDTLITSGYTSNFPEGLPVGEISNYTIEEGAPFYTIKVKLATNFRTMTHVTVIDYKKYSEQKSLEDALLEEN